MTLAAAASRRGGALVVLAVLTAALTFAYRFLAHGGFSNDHFVHLARAQAIVAGELPVRDFVEEGSPLMAVVSAAAQRFVAEALVSELLLSVASLSVAAGVTCLLASRLTGSLLLGMFAAALQVLIRPRLYSHPKMLLYAVMIALCWSYVRGPSRRRLILMAAWVALAFLVRHDHGVYTAIAAVAAVTLGELRAGVPAVLRASARLTAWTVLFVVPYLAYVQYHEGVIPYFSRGLEFRQHAGGRVALEWPRFDPWPDGALLVRRAPLREDLAPLRIRWQSHVSDEERLAHERTWRLLYPHRDHAATWVYFVEPSAPREVLSQMVRHPDVADTHGVDRRTLRLIDAPAGFRALLARSGVYRLEAGPPVRWFTSAATALAFTYAALWLTPVFALAVVLLIRRHDVHIERGPMVLVLIVTALAGTAGLAREARLERVADAFGSFPVLFAWLIAALAVVPRGRVGCMLGRATAALLFVAMLGYSARLGETGEAIRLTHVRDGFAAVRERARNVTRATTAWPWPQQWPSGDGWRIAQYVHDCTRPGDRLLVTAFAPEYYYFSRRPFAGGVLLLVPVVRPPHTYESDVIERLRQQSVPIVLTEATNQREFVSLYPALSADIARRYREIAVVDGGPERRIVINVQVGLQPVGWHPPSGWPCFSP